MFRVCLTLITVARGAAVCLLAQPRPHNAPSNLTISQALHRTLATRPHSICSGEFPALPNGSAGNVARRFTGSLVLEITRDSATVQTNHTCVDAFNEIIHRCIRRGIYWGGTVISDGANHTIYNSKYPANWTPSPSDRKPSRISQSPNGHRPLIPTHDTVRNNHIIATQQLTRSARKSQHTKASSVKITALEKWTTQTLSKVTGSPNSYSQTNTTDVYGHKTALPVWFGPLGVGILVAPVAALVPGVVVPPPPGFPPLHIGPDGQASITDQPQRQTSDHRRSTRTISSPLSSTVASTSSHVSPTGSATSAGSSLQMIIPKDRQAQANNALTSELKRIFGTNMRTVETISSGLLFWEAYLSPEQATQYAAHPAVSVSFCED